MTGNGVPPPRQSIDPNSDTFILIYGTAFFIFLIFVAARRFFPSAFAKMTFGLFDAPEEFTLTKQIAQLRFELESLKSYFQKSKSDALVAVVRKIDGEVPGDDIDQDSEPPVQVDLSKQIDHIVAKRLTSIADEMPLVDLLSIRKSLIDIEAKGVSSRNFGQMIDVLLENSIRMRNRVFTLFAGVNLWLVICALFVGVLANVFSIKLEISNTLIQTVFGFYISMAIFLVYVFRNSSSRISVLLALRENETHHHNAFGYLSSLNPSEVLSKRDIELLKLIFVNHSEKEKGNEHPYESFIKGVSNSTVFLRGGRVTTPEDKDGEKSNESSGKK